jgi:hypothetical protein
MTDESIRREDLVPVYSLYISPETAGRHDDDVPPMTAR